MDITELLEARRADNTPLLVSASASNGVIIGYNVKARVLGFLVDMFVRKSDASELEACQVYWNKAIDKPPYTDEFRFLTHSFANPASWDGRTNGDPAKSWSEANGATAYDDVAYRWEDANGDPICYLSGPSIGDPPPDDGIGYVWKKSSDNSAIVQFNATSQHWERQDNNANVTSSRWSIVPYPNTKMDLQAAVAAFHRTAEMGVVSEVIKSLRYKIYAGPYLIREFVYSSVGLMKLAANTRQYDGDDVFSEYDYDKTVHPMIDSRFGMRLDIALDDHVPVVSTTPSRATFIGIKRVSF